MSSSSFVVLVLLVLLVGLGDHCRLCRAYEGLVGGAPPAAAAASVVNNIGGKEKVWCNMNGCFSANSIAKASNSSSNHDDEEELVLVGVEEGGDQRELLRHYAAGARWLLGVQQRPGYRSLQKPPVYPTKIYGDAINKNTGSHRDCSRYNRCQHDSQ